MLIWGKKDWKPELISCVSIAAMLERVALKYNSLMHHSLGVWGHVIFFNMEPRVVNLTFTCIFISESGAISVLFMQRYKNCWCFYHSISSPANSLTVLVPFSSSSRWATAGHVEDASKLLVSSVALRVLIGCEIAVPIHFLFREFHISDELED